MIQPHGAGYSRPWAVSVDSKLGVQMDARFNDKLSAVAQAVSQYNSDGTYTPQIEWANLSYKFTPDFMVRVGRFAATTFMLSDTSLVGYTYPWIRPPQEVYGALPVTNKDGIDAIYHFPLGAAVDTVQVSYGRNVKKLSNDIEITANHYLDVHNIVEYAKATVRVGYTSFDAEVAGSPSFDAEVAGPPPFDPEVTGSSISPISRYSIVTIGASYEPGDWLLMAEWANVTTSIVVSNLWYVTAGYRIAAFTPYLTVAQIKAEQDSVSAGVRWDLKKNVALKMQYDHLRIGNTGRLINVQPGYQPGGKVNVFSLAIDFVF
jgi:hypothetical protein